MKKAHMIFFIAGFICICIFSFILFQNAQSPNELSNIVNISFVVFGAAISFIQLFFSFPIFSGQKYNNSSSSTSAYKSIFPMYSSSSLLLGSRSLLVIRGLCFIITSIFATGSDGGPVTSTRVIALGSLMFLSGMATTGIALQEWNVSRKYRWFLPEGILGILAGFLFISFESQAPNVLPGSTPFWMAASILWLILAGLWLILTTIGEIVASNGWALTIGGFLTLLEIGFIIVAVVGVNTSFFAYSIFLGYPIFFGIMSVIGAFQ